VTDKDFHELRARYRAAFDACRDFFGKNVAELTDDQIKAFDALEEARAALMAAIGSTDPDLN